MSVRCPGQDMRYWKPEDIFWIDCPHCKAELEFWKDEPFRLCKSCQKEVRNPRQDFGCAKWCKFAKECLGTLAEDPGKAASVCERILAELKKRLGDDSAQLRQVLRRLHLVELGLKEPSDSAAPARIATLLAGLPQDEALQILGRAQIEAPLIEKAAELLRKVQGGQLQDPEARLVAGAMRQAEAESAVPPA